MLAVRLEVMNDADEVACTTKNPFRTLKCVVSKTLVSLVEGEVRQECHCQETQVHEGSDSDVRGTDVSVVVVVFRAPWWLVTSSIMKRALAGAPSL